MKKHLEKNHNKNMTNDYNIEQIIFQTFVSRSDAYAIQNRDGSYLKIEKELTFDDINEHLEGTKTIGIYQIDANNQTKLLCLDIDLRSNAFENNNISDEQWRRLRDTASSLVRVCVETGIKPLLEYSGRRGYHLWVFFNNPIEASIARNQGNWLRNKAGRLDDDIAIEVFPKQDSISENGFGNLIKLPLGVHQVSGERSKLLDLQTHDQIIDIGSALQAIEHYNPDIDHSELTNEVTAIYIDPKPIDKQVSSGMRPGQPGLDQMIKNCPVIQKFEADPNWVTYNQWLGIASNYFVFDGGWERFVEVSRRDLKRFNQSKIDQIKNDLTRWHGPQTYTKFREQGLTIELPNHAPRAPAGWANFSSSPTDLAAILHGGKNDRPPEDIGLQIFNWFTSNGAAVYRDRNHNGYWAWNDQIYEVGHGQPFHTLIWNTAKVTHEGTDGRKIWAVLKAETDSKGALLTECSWLHSKVADRVIYINPNNDDARLIRIDPDGVSVVPNGTNDDHVLLMPAYKMEPFTFTNLSAEDYFKTWNDYSDLVWNNLTCSPTDRWLYCCWSLSYPLFDFARTIPIMRCEGYAGSGKTYAMNIVSHFVYGDSQLKRATEAANYADASQNPVLFLDNVEVSNFTQGLGDFLLMGATGIQKEKRKMGTDREVVIEKMRCLINTNGIESLGKREHIDRTLTINFDRSAYGSRNFSEMIYGSVHSKRSEFCSAQMMLISKVLGKISQGGIEKWIKYLEAHHPDHAKNRINSFLSLMALVLEELIPEDSVEATVAAWIESQDAQGREADAGTNSVVNFFNAVCRDWQDLNDNTQWVNWGYEVKVTPNNADHRRATALTVTGTASQFLNTFSACSKRKKLYCEYRTAMQLTKRFNDAARVFDDLGITMDVRKNRDKINIYTFTIPVNAGIESSDEALPAAPPAPLPAA